MNSVEWHEIRKRIGQLQEHIEELSAEKTTLQRDLARVQNENVLIAFELKLSQSKYDELNKCFITLESLKASPPVAISDDNIAEREKSSGSQLQQSRVCKTSSEEKDSAELGSKAQHAQKPAKNHQAANKLECIGCTRAFSNQTQLSRHTRDNSSLEIYACQADKCGAEFKLRCMLEVHLCKHADKQMNVFVCEHDGCGKSYSCQSNLKRHSRLHDDFQSEDLNRPKRSKSSIGEQCVITKNAIFLTNETQASRRITKGPPAGDKSKRELNLIGRRQSEYI